MINRVYLKQYHFFAIVLLLLVAACAPDDLDFTPTAAPTNTPAPTPTPTPLPAGEVDNLQRAIDAFLAVVPARLGSGAVEWRRDFTRGNEGVEIPPNVQGGLAVRVFYTEQTGGQANLTFGIFDSDVDAAAHYDRMRNVRRGVLDTGGPNENFPMPNLFGAGLYGSVAIFQIDTLFVEVNIEAFSSTQGNPLVPLSRSTLALVDQVMAEVESGGDES